MVISHPMRYPRRILVLTALLVAVPATAAAQPAAVLHVSFKARGIPAGTPLRAGHRTFVVSFRTLVFATATLTDPATGAPLGGIPVRLTGQLALSPAAPTNSGGSAILRLKPLVTGEYTFDVPSIAGTVAQHATFRVAPDWKIGRPLPLLRGKLVVSGRLLALKSVREFGSYVSLQRRIHGRWVTVKRLAISRALLVSARVPSSFEGSKLRFVYVSKTDDYVGSSRAFTAKVGTADSDNPPADGGGSTNFGGGGNGLAGGDGGNCAGVGC